MTPKQADLIRHSFDAIWPVRRKVAELFYRRFFELAPDAQRLFPSDMERQHLKLMDMIAAIVGALDEHELFQSIIRHTGRQHADLGVKRSHFDAFGDALIWCLEHQFGAAFPPELREAWARPTWARGLSRRRRCAPCLGVSRECSFVRFFVKPLASRLAS